jgi:N-formylglutamate deformylase
VNPVSVTRGTGPIILGQPHSGQYIPPDILCNLNSLGRKIIDTDWHVPRLYSGLLDNVTTVQANFNRYVIDANRDPEGKSLYLGQNTTELVPTSTFDGDPIWCSPLKDADIRHRLDAFHRPYHQVLEEEIHRIKSIHGAVVLYDCHSIRSEIPYLFDSQLPDLSIGDSGGSTCSGRVTQAIAATCADAHEYSHVINGRFKGGWTTRHYGHPEEGVHAVQMELAQRRYLKSEVPPFSYDVEQATQLRCVLKNILLNIEIIFMEMPSEQNFQN